MSIWEVRNKKQHFVYSKIMLWVAFDRGLRLADKRCLPCPNRAAWTKIRDEIYEEVMEKGTFIVYVCEKFSNSLLIIWFQRLQQGKWQFHPKLRRWQPGRLFHPDRSSCVLYFAKWPTIYRYNWPHSVTAGEGWSHLNRTCLSLRYRVITGWYVNATWIKLSCANWI